MTHIPPHASAAYQEPRDLQYGIVAVEVDAVRGELIAERATQLTEGHRRDTDQNLEHCGGHREAV